MFDMIIPSISYHFNVTPGQQFGERAYSQIGFASAQVLCMDQPPQASFRASLPRAKETAF